MQAKAGDIDLIDGLRCFQYAKNPAQPYCVLGDDTGFGAGIEEGAQPSVWKLVITQKM